MPAAYQISIILAAVAALALGCWEWRRGRVIDPALIIVNALGAAMLPSLYQVLRAAWYDDRAQLPTEWPLVMFVVTGVTGFILLRELRRAFRL